MLVTPSVQYTVFHIDSDKVGFALRLRQAHYLWNVFGDIYDMAYVPIPD